MPATPLRTARRPRRTRQPGVLLPFPTVVRKRRRRGLRLRRLLSAWQPGRASVRALGRRLLPWLAWPLIALLLVIAAYNVRVFCEVWHLRAHKPSTTAFMRSALERLRAGD
jgi:hypothetical protein